MLLLLIPLAWLALVTVLVAVCRTAAAGDTLAPQQHADAPIGPRLTLSAGPAPAHSSRAHSIRRRRLAAHRGARRRVLAS